MNIEIANACYGYLEALYDLNKNIIKLCGADIMLHNEDAISLSMKIVSEFTRIMPYTWSKREQKYVLSFGDGLLEYKDDILYFRGGVYQEHRIRFLSKYFYDSRCDLGTECGYN